MGALLITYDLNKPGQNYDSLYEAIKGLGSWWRYLDSTWIVDTSLTTSVASERLRTALDTSDNLLVIDIISDTYSGWLSQKAWEWLNQHV